jgi:hypothetical protein
VAYWAVPPGNSQSSTSERTWGQTAESLGQVLFPNSKIYSFEPVPATFAKLRQNTVDLAQVECVEMAMGTSLEKPSSRATATAGTPFSQGYRLKTPQQSKWAPLMTSVPIAAFSASIS